MATLGLLPAASVASEAGAHAAKAAPAVEKLRLKSFGSCAGLIRYGRRHAKRGPGAGPPPPLVEDIGVVPPRRDEPLGPGLPPPGLPRAESDEGAAQGDSQTNVQEAGVDEPDIVKSAGGRIFALARGRLHVVDAARLELLDSLELEGWGHQLLLSGMRVLVISQSDTIGSGSSRGLDDVTQLTEVDVSDPAAIEVLRTERIRGVHVSSRLTGHTARVVVWSRPRAVIEPAFRSRLRGWLPRRVLRSRVSGRLRFRRAAGCRRVLRPAALSGTDTLTVLTVDLSKGLPAVDSDAILSGGQIAYASKDSLYVATPRWTPEPTAGETPPERATTLIHRFDITGESSTSYRASGAVPGYLLNQFSMSEHHGVLRVASTEEPAWWPGASDEQSESRVTTLVERDGALLELGHAGGLGKGERIYAVRFIGDAGYVVTFRQTDPLYTLDLARPGRPRVAGELKILGYSAYLHPISGDLLLGVGQDATERGTTLGTQLSLFDVSELERPRRLRRLTVEQSSSSEVEYDHHAFLWWAPANLAVLPVHSYAYTNDDTPPFSGAIGFGVERASGIRERGRAVHDADSERLPWPIERTFVVGGRLFTLSQLGIEMNAIADLSETGWLGFGQP